MEPVSRRQPTAATGAGIMVAPAVANNVWWNGWVAAARTAAASLGMTTYDANFNGDTATQVAAFAKAKSLGLKAAITMANIAVVSPRLFQICQRDEIYGYNCHSNQPWSTPLDIGDYYVGYVDFPHQRSYEAICTSLFEKMGGQGRVIHITGFPGVLASDFRTEGVDQALEKFPGIELVAREPGYYGRADTIPVVHRLLTAHPDVRGIICANDDSALGAIAVLKSRGMLDTVLVVGVDAVPEMLDAIIDGDAFATVVNPGEWMGGYMVVRLFDAINGVKYDDLERMQMFSTFVLNTKEAAQAYQKLQQARFPYDWPKMSRFLHPDDWDVQIGLKNLEPARYWKLFDWLRPARYEFAPAYQSAKRADYERLNAVLADHLTFNQLDAVRELTDPVVDVLPSD